MSEVSIKGQRRHVVIDGRIIIVEVLRPAVGTSVPSFWCISNNTTCLVAADNFCHNHGNWFFTRGSMEFKMGWPNHPIEVEELPEPKI